MVMNSKLPPPQASTHHRTTPTSHWLYFHNHHLSSQDTTLAQIPDHARIAAKYTAATTATIALPNCVSMQYGAYYLFNSPNSVQNPVVSEFCRWLKSDTESVIQRN
jgi:hypothetical protein